MYSNKLSVLTEETLKIGNFRGSTLQKWVWVPCGSLFLLFSITQKRAVAPLVFCTSQRKRYYLILGCGSFGEGGGLVCKPTKVEAWYQNMPHKFCIHKFALLAFQIKVFCLANLNNFSFKTRRKKWANMSVGTYEPASFLCTKHKL